MIVAEISFTRYDAAVKETDQRLDRITEESVREGARRGVNFARANHRHKNRTGALVSPTNLRVKYLGVVDGTAVAVMVNTAPHARWIEYGAPAHWIEASNRDVLAFEWLGQLVFFKRVYHPGIKEGDYTFMRPAAEYAREVTRRIAVTGIRKLAREVWS